MADFENKLPQNVPPSVQKNLAKKVAKNVSNLPGANLNTDVKANVNIQGQPTPAQSEFNGPVDLPAYAGIANMSLKSWISNHENKAGNSKSLFLLPHIFSGVEHSGCEETELLVNVLNFKKLGSPLSRDKDITISPPLPQEMRQIKSLDTSRIKYLFNLFALPKEFPEGLRFFAKESLNINEKDYKSFLESRLSLLREQSFSDDGVLSLTIQNFTNLLNKDSYPLLLPLILLYYPLPLPHILETNDFTKIWKKTETETEKEQGKIIASCEIYYISQFIGNYLIKFELSDKNELFFDIQTSKLNKDIVGILEEAVSESMFLLANPPLLSDLNVMLTDEIYEATDTNENLAIISKGPIRLEIVLAVYSVLFMLNKINTEIEHQLPTR